MTQAQREERRESVAAPALANAARFVQGLFKAVKGFAVYLPNNPLNEKFFGEAYEQLQDFLAAHGELRLGVRPDAITHEGRAVYENLDPQESYSFRMYADGIRELSFLPKTIPSELRAVINALSQRSRTSVEGDRNEDIVTLLWSADLHNVTYSLAENPTNVSPAELGVRALREGESAAPVRVPPADGFASAMVPLPIPQPVVTLDDDEVQELLDLVAKEARRVPHEDVCDILDAVLPAETDPESFGEFLGIVVGIVADLLRSGETAPAVALVRTLAKLQAQGELDVARVSRLAVARQGLHAPPVVEALGAILESGPRAAREDGGRFVEMLDPAAVAPLCRLLGDLQSREGRKTLLEGLARLGREVPGSFFTFLGDPRWYLVRNIVLILHKIGFPAANERMLQVAAHAEERVRREVLAYFENLAGNEGEEGVLRFLDDLEPAIRITAVRNLAHRQSARGAAHLIALRERPQFATRDLTEREAVCEALGQLAPEKMLPEFSKMLGKRHLLHPSRAHEETAMAAAGLKGVGSETASILLRAAVAVKKGKAREAVEAALRALEAAHRRTASLPSPGE